MGKRLVIFTLDGCGHCTDLKIALNQKSIEFFEIEINQNQKIWNKVVEQTGENILPTIFIQNENSETGLIFLPDKDFKSTEEAIKKIEKHI
jgi:glutaredoxin